MPSPSSRASPPTDAQSALQYALDGGMPEAMARKEPKLKLVGEWLAKRVVVFRATHGDGACEKIR